MVPLPTVDGFLMQRAIFKLHELHIPAIVILHRIFISEAFYSTKACHSWLWPHLIDVLFLGYFPDMFQRVERNNNKNKRKNRQKIGSTCKMFRKIV